MVLSLSSRHAMSQLQTPHLNQRPSMLEYPCCQLSCLPHPPNALLHGRRLVAAARQSQHGCQPCGMRRTVCEGGQPFLPRSLLPPLCPVSCTPHTTAAPAGCLCMVAAVCCSAHPALAQPYRASMGLGLSLCGKWSRISRIRTGSLVLISEHCSGITAGAHQGWVGAGRGGGMATTHGLLLSCISSDKPRRADTTHAGVLDTACCWRGMLVHADVEASNCRVRRQVEQCMCTERREPNLCEAGDCFLKLITRPTSICETQSVQRLVRAVTLALAQPLPCHTAIAS